MMLPIRRNHENWTCVLIAQLGIRQKRGEGLVACPGLINGIFGSGEERHIAAWKSKKVANSGIGRFPPNRAIVCTWAGRWKHRLEAVK
jgi:hypothetical protein